VLHLFTCGLLGQVFDDLLEHVDFLHVVEVYLEDLLDYELDGGLQFV